MTLSEGVRLELFLKEREQVVRDRQEALRLAGEAAEAEAMQLARDREELTVERRRLELERQEISALRDIFRVERVRFEKEFKTHLDRVDALRAEAEALETKVCRSRDELTSAGTPEDHEHADLREVALVAAIARLTQREQEFTEEAARERRRLELEGERLSRKREELSQREKSIRN